MIGGVHCRLLSVWLEISSAVPFHACRWHLWVLSAALFHTMLSLDLPDKSIHGFNEVCSECPRQALHGGWDTVNAPKGLCGLGLRKFRYLTLRSAQDGYGSRVQTNINPGGNSVYRCRYSKVLFQTATDVSWATAKGHSR